MVPSNSMSRSILNAFSTAVFPLLDTAAVMVGVLPTVSGLGSVDSLMLLHVRSLPVHVCLHLPSTTTSWFELQHACVPSQLPLPS